MGELADTHTHKHTHINTHTRASPTQVLGWSSLSLLGPEVQELLCEGGHSLGPALTRDALAASRAVPNLLNCRDVMQVR